MNKIAFVMSSILAYIGILLFAWTRAVKSLYPKIGYLIYTAKSEGSYNSGDYMINTNSVTALSLICIVAGIILCCVFYKKGLKKECSG